MELKRSAPGDRAVSQVVAVVLLIAVVLLMAAVIGPVVIGLGEGTAKGKPAPQAKFSWSYDGDTSPTVLNVTHEGGETIRRGRIRFVGSESGELSPTWSGDGDDRVSVDETGTFTGVRSDEIVRVFWSAPKDDSQQLIAQWIGPDAEPPDG